MFVKRRKVAPTALSPDLRQAWGWIPVRHLVLASRGYIVFIDEELEVDWKSTAEWDDAHRGEREEFGLVLNRAAAIEFSEWDSSDEQRTLHFKRQIGEAIVR